MTKILNNYLLAGMAFLGTSCQSFYTSLSDKKAVEIGHNLHDIAAGVKGPYLDEKAPQTGSQSKWLTYERAETGEKWQINVLTDNEVTQRDVMGYYYFQADRITGDLNVTACFGADMSTVIYNKHMERVVSNIQEFDSEGFDGDRSAPLKKLFPNWQSKSNNMQALWRAASINP